MLIKKWNIKSNEKGKILKLTNDLKLKQDTISKLLLNRNIDNFEDAKNYFNPSISGIHDPYLMKDMDKAVDKIISYINNRKRILIYGDYDVDGTTSVALMYLFLKNLNLELEYYIPDRYKEGYGISIDGIDYASINNFDLIISLDCGITAIDKIEYANKKNIDFIICDHHLPGDVIPNAFAILNPKQKDCNYPFKELSGCGVGFKLCEAISKRLNLEENSYLQFLDLVAVSIASDIVPIIDENRILAFEGLKKLNTNPSIGLNSIIKETNIKNKNISISDIVFQIGPKINAPGRMQHARESIKALISQDSNNSKEKTDNLININDERRITDQQITQEIFNTIDNDESIKKGKSIILFSDKWHKGVIGIVASRMVEAFYKPTIIFSLNGDMLTGSARSIKGFSIYQGLKKVDKHIHQYGGHDFAAGVTLKKDNFDKFKMAFETEACDVITDDMLIPEIEIDCELKFNEINFNLYKSIERMSPFGPMNMQPVFCTYNLKNTGYTKIVGKNHIKFHLIDENGVDFKGICFGLGDFYDIKDIKKNNINICYSLYENEYNNRKNIELLIKDIQIVD